ncbi:pro-corazonin [Halyomorpha halys]|uniref:pro-corazonin n=1 Tax=Halyomorpha halys TaxID=286706 RepID=UPI0006D4EEDF|nr:pro-corazonin [Halyomorpha halys]
MWCRLQSLLLIAILVGSALAQTFQYSRGWTNGKRSFPGSQTACQIQRLRAMLQGKPISPSYHLLCDLYRLPEEELKMDQLDKTLRNPGPEDAIEK